MKTDLGIAASICAFLLGLNLGQLFPPLPKAQLSTEVEPNWFQRNECKTIDNDYGGSKECILKLQHRKMTLEFVTRDQFDAMNPPPPEAAGYKSGGFARIDKRPCEIVIPIDDAALESHPYSFNGFVSWSGRNYGMDRVIAHEILHCYTGRWHADYIAGLQFRERYESGQRSRAYETRFFADFYLKPRLKPEAWDLRPAYVQNSAFLLASK